jgi:hypothetical protein
MGDQPAVATTPQGAPTTGADSVPMLFNDGTHGLVPLANVQGAIKDGGKVAQYVKFDDGTQGPVPLEKVHDALNDGGQLIGTPPHAPAPPTLSKDEIAWGQAGESAERTSAAAGKSMQLALGMSPIGGGPGLKAIEAEVPSLKTLYRIAKETIAKSDVASDEIEALGWKKFSDTAYQGAAEASQAGKYVRAAGYTTASMMAKAYSKYEDAWAFIGKNAPLLPVGLKIAVAGEIAKKGYDWVMRDDEEEK